MQAGQALSDPPHTAALAFAVTLVRALVYGSQGGSRATAVPKKTRDGLLPSGQSARFGGRPRRAGLRKAVSGASAIGGWGWDYTHMESAAGWDDAPIGGSRKRRNCRE